MLKLEVGKSYVNQKGKVVKIVENDEDGPYCYLGADNLYYTEKGEWCQDAESPDDLISEHIDERDARIAELEGQIKGERDQADLIAKDRDFTIQTLKVRVEELEEEVANNQKYVHVNLFEKLKHERDSLRTQLAEANEKLHKIVDVRKQRERFARRINELEEQLAALKPAEPTIVKTTWQALTINGMLLDVCCYKQRADQASDHCNPLQGHLRRDTYSDGKVVATLEPIGGEK